MSNTITNRPKVDLSGKVALITGAGSEFGLALALLAAHRGMKVALADADPVMLTAVHEIIRSKAVETLAECTEPSDLAALQQLACRIEEELGPPWLVCNSAAASTIESNLWGVVNGVQVFTPGMVMRGAGHMVNIAAEELFGIRGAAVDIAVRHAIVGLSESLYRELDSMRSQVGVTVVRPSSMDISLKGISSMPVLARKENMRLLPLDEIAEQIFAAIQTREFWVSSHAPQMHQTTRSTPPCFGWWRKVLETSMHGSSRHNQGEAHHAGANMISLDSSPA
jgi:NAD(P)-dependent dehydrogenase (short-subunit alcohol dehydrogenase family)